MTLFYHVSSSESLCFMCTVTSGLVKLSTTLESALVLRVSGYHQQLFVLDVQVRYLDLKSLDASGQWLARKWMLCQKKKKIALEGLRELGTDDDILREEWSAQLQCILALEKTLESHQSIVRELEHQLISNNNNDITTFNLQLNDAHA
ncbi:hypothetical protein AZE42_13475 [Rhizopogon vesiculosus]|uniref:Uncharacterized protein n=1 Tax=Rhizopogon vesiculosus TaxID=180088 RepID=A0A1J8PL68_9AGAM|nr:hypothetical protein AZE42_13475 [Rhizopogon vesiculosus]